MHRLKGFDGLKLMQGCVLSIGNFDGVHRGHQSILSALLAQARQRSLPAVVMTFEPHPAALLSPGRQPPRLTTAAGKAELLGTLGVDFVVEYPTDWALLHLSPREFFDEVVVGRLQARGLVEGPNFFFGRNRSGNGETLREFCSQGGQFLEIVSPQGHAGQLVSSSLIRDALSSGNVSLAADLLGRPYSLVGTVVGGAQRGRTLGFPTANLEHVETMIPGNGVYAARATAGGTDYLAAVSIGPNPTFGEQSQKIEAHLLDASVDLYGAELELRFAERIRGQATFTSVGQLQHQIAKDVAAVRLSLAAFGNAC